MTLRDLARRTGISNATISLIENNRTSPSVGLLKCVLDGIPMSLSAFFASNFAPDTKYFYAREELTEIGDARLSLRQFDTNLKDRKLQIMHEHFSTGADSGEIPLRHEGEEGGGIIAGRLEVTVAGRVQVLGPGDAYNFDSRLPHRTGSETSAMASASVSARARLRPSEGFVTGPAASTHGVLSCRPSSRRGGRGVSSVRNQGISCHVWTPPGGSTLAPSMPSGASTPSKPIRRIIPAREPVSEFAETVWGGRWPARRISSPAALRWTSPPHTVDWPSCGVGKPC
jgi:transcriptional regulator with XRE-family HTH domain